MKLHVVWLAGLSLMLAACKGPVEESADELDVLTTLMTGSFSSAEQAARDSNYYDITLHMYPIWEGQDEEVQWLYVEQAVTSMQEKPYRQRVYKVEQENDSTWKSSVYTLAYPEAATGKWRSPVYFDSLTTADLTLRTGCAVYLNKTGAQSFKGSTNPKSCESTLRGASYATSVVEVMADRIESWDQGFDANDEQVWGATEGGYVFVRNEPPAPAF